MELTRETIVDALTEIGERLRRQGKIGEITVFGGGSDARRRLIEDLAAELGA